MNDQPRAAGSAPELDKSRANKPPSPPSGQAQFEQGDAAATNELPESKELTAEEQMALYEKDLKENDWGHQPC